MVQFIQQKKTLESRFSYKKQLSKVFFNIIPACFPPPHTRHAVFGVLQRKLLVQESEQPKRDTVEMSGLYIVYGEK